METNTPLVFSETQKMLVVIIEKLSGPHGKEWLETLEKIFSTNAVPQISPEIKSFLATLETGKSLKHKLDSLVSCIESIPVVSSVVITVDLEYYSTVHGQEILQICIYDTINMFVTSNKDEQDEVTFSLYADMKVTSTAFIPNEGSLCEKWFKEHSFDKEGGSVDFEYFYKALFELGEMYKNTIPNIPNN